MCDKISCLRSYFNNFSTLLHAGCLPLPFFILGVKAPPAPAVMQQAVVTLSTFSHGTEALVLFPERTIPSPRRVPVGEAALAKP